MYMDVPGSEWFKLQYTGYGYGMGSFPETLLKCYTANVLGGYSTRISILGTLSVLGSLRLLETTQNVTKVLTLHPQTCHHSLNLPACMSKVYSGNLIIEHSKIQVTHSNPTFRGPHCILVCSN